MTALFALLIGIVAGLRAMTPLAAVSWAAWLGWLPLADTSVSFIGHWLAAAFFTIAALAEFVTDQLPSTPSRKVPQQFGARLVTGGVSGAALGVATGSTWVGLIAGLVGAVIGTYGGAEVRGWLGRAFGRDLPAALIEDAIAIALAWFVVANIL